MPLKHYRTIVENVEQEDDPKETDEKSKSKSRQHLDVSIICQLNT